MKFTVTKNGAVSTDATVTDPADAMAQRNLILQTAQKVEVGTLVITIETTESDLDSFGKLVDLRRAAILERQKAEQDAGLKTNK